MCVIVAQWVVLPHSTAPRTSGLAYSCTVQVTPARFNSIGANVSASISFLKECGLSDTLSLVSPYALASVHHGLSSSAGQESTMCAVRPVASPAGRWSSASCAWCLCGGRRRRRVSDSSRPRGLCSAIVEVTQKTLAVSKHSKNTDGRQSPASMQAGTTRTMTPCRLSEESSQSRHLSFVWTGAEQIAPLLYRRSLAS